MRRRTLLGLGLSGAAGYLLPSASASDRSLARKEGALATGFEPMPLAGRGYRLVFRDEFDGPLEIGENGYRWSPHLWYDRPAEARQYGVRDSCLFIRCFRDNGWASCSIAAEWPNTRTGTFFRGGYLEARMKCAKAWNAFWMFSTSQSRSIPKDSPERWGSELDIVETDSAHPNWFVGTLHRNTGGSQYGGPADGTNHNNIHDVGIDLFETWHVFAALWTRHQVAWFLDGREVARCPTFESSWQPMFPIFGLGPGGVNGGPPPSADVATIELLVDWVRVWQRPEAGDRFESEG
jgi:hypothetical protein